MAYFAYHDNILSCEKISIPDLVDLYGSPIYVYSSNAFKKQFQKLSAALSQHLSSEHLIAYACKANDRIAFLELVAELGGGVDIVSGGELKKALSAGIKPEKIVFSGVGKNYEELTLALKHHIRQINIESASELHNLMQLSQEKRQSVQVVFRLNPDVEAGTHDKISTGRGEDKFGISTEEICDLYQQAESHQFLVPIGLSMHIGSQVADPRYFIPAFEKMKTLVERLRGLGCTVEDLDLGGGLGITYRDEPEADLDGYARLIEEILGDLHCRFTFEPGKFLVGNAGILISKILYHKQTPLKTHLIMDAAMNDLIRPALYEAWHRIEPVVRHDTHMHLYDIVGPVCETGDTFAKDRPLPDVQEGELLAFHSAGAYGSTMASYYNSRPPASEILVDGREHQLIYRPMSIDELIEKERHLRIS